MAARKRYLVPLDFSRSSEIALNHAVRLARESGGELLLVHVLDDPASHVPAPMRENYYKELEKEARATVAKLVRRKKLGDREYRFVLLQGADAARLIAEQAKASRATMIVMGTHGRTGLRRLVLGSVAEKTLRHAPCPVLIVKR